MKARIVLKGLRCEDSFAELCRKERIDQNLYYRWSKDFSDAIKKRLVGDTAREPTTVEVKSLRSEASHLEEILVEVMMEKASLCYILMLLLQPFPHT